MTHLAAPPPLDLVATPGNRGPKAIAIVSVFSVLAVISVVLRVISRRIKKARWLASDYTIILGLLGSWVVTGLVIAEVHYGVGKHIGEVISGEGSVKSLLQFAYAAQISYIFTISIVKISILLLYCSLFPGHGFAIFINIVGAFVIVWAICVGLMAMFSCVPINGNWDLDIQATCVHSSIFVTGSSVPNILIDVAILCLAVVKVWNLHMTLRQKLAVIGMFLTGSFVIIASIIRISTIRSIDPEDVSWSTYGIAVWSAIEISVAVISACLPALRPFFEYIMPKKFHFCFRSSKSFQVTNQMQSNEAQSSNTESLRRLRSDSLAPNPLPTQDATLKMGQLSFQAEEDGWMRDERLENRDKGISV